MKKLFSILLLTKDKLPKPVFYALVAILLAASAASTYCTSVDSTSDVCQIITLIQ